MRMKQAKKAKQVIAYSTTGALGIDVGLLCANSFDTPMFAPGVVTGMLIGLTATFHLLPTVAEALQAKRQAKAGSQSRHPSMLNRTRNIPNPRRGE